MASVNSGNERQARTPPYVSWKTFRSFVQDLHEHGVPSRIDRSVLTRYSGVVGTQSMTALRFFGFIDDQGHPTTQFRALVAAHGSSDWPKELGEIVRATYAPMFQIDLETATPSHFTETFRKAFPGSDAVLQKSATFFLYAAQEAGVPVSTRVLKGRKPRSSNGQRRPRASKPESASKSAEAGGADARQSPSRDRGDLDAFRKDLLNKFPLFDPSWPDNIKAEWFKGFEQFMAMAKK